MKIISEIISFGLKPKRSRNAIKKKEEDRVTTKRASLVVTLKTTDVGPPYVIKSEGYY